MTCFEQFIIMVILLKKGLITFYLEFLGGISQKSF